MLLSRYPLLSLTGEPLSPGEFMFVRGDRSGVFGGVCIITALSSVVTAVLTGDLIMAISGE